MSTDTLADAELLERIHDLVVRQRLPLRRAGEILGMPHQVVWELIERHYPKARRRRHLALRNAERIVELRLSGMRAEDISKVIGCSSRSVFRVFREAMEADIVSELGGDASMIPKRVQDWRCPIHGVVKFKPCVACMATDHKRA